MIKYLAGLFLALGLTTAQAQPVVVEAHHPSGITIQLHNEDGPCVGGAKLATWISADRKSKVQGCWKATDAVVSIVFFDTDTAAVPVSAFKAPKTL